MSVFLRDVRTGNFLQESGGWNASRSGAHDFYDVLVAVERIMALHLKGVEIVLSFEDPQSDVTLPSSALMVMH
jgi:hypothetical protein